MFELDLRSRTPIYEQLTDKIKDLIVSNVLKADEQLPAVRVLAGQLTVNPNTVQKAYRELEYRGYIYSLPGKGNFVKATVAENNSVRLQSLEKDFGRIVAEMIFLGKPAQEIVNLLQSCLAKSKGGNVDD